MSTVYFDLSSGNLLEDWSNIGRITVNDDWTNVPSIVGYLGDVSATTITNADAQTVTGGATGVVGAVDVIANQTNTTLNSGGVAEFHLANPTVALQGSGTADAPSLVFYLNASGRENVTVSFNVRDIDAVDNAVQQVAVQYRIGGTGPWINLPAGYVADATTTGSATQQTAVSVTLPAAVNGQGQVQVRVLTVDATGSDEWIGIDDIVVASVPAGSTPVAQNGTLAIGNASIVEGDDGVSQMEFVVSRTGGTDGAVSATYTISFNGSADAADIAAAALSGTVTFEAGQTSATIRVPIAGDTAVEPTETFAVTLSAPTGGATIATATATGTITNDDFPPAANVFINEINSIPLVPTPANSSNWPALPEPTSPAGAWCSTTAMAAGPTRRSRCRAS